MVEGQNFHHMFQSQYLFGLGEKRPNFHHGAPVAPFEKVMLSCEKCQIPNFWKMAKIKKMAKTWPFLVKMAPDVVLQLSLPIMGHFHFQTKKIHSQTKLLAAILYFSCLLYTSPSPRD